MRANKQPPVVLELEDIKSEADDSDSAPPDYNIATYPADFTLELFHQKWKLGELIIHHSGVPAPICLETTSSKQAH